MAFFDKIKEGLTKTKAAFSEKVDGIIASFRKVDEELLTDLEDALIMADVGVETSVHATKQLREEAKKTDIKTEEDLRRTLRQILSGMLCENNGLLLNTKPSVILVIGVNGVGKTTTIGKIAAKLKAEGKKVMLAAADTFRAAAAEQLQIWAERAGVDIVRHNEGSDPASVIFDAISAAKARGSDVIICDTAGRLHNKSNLMNELNKIDKIITRELPEADRETLLVLDATTGQNAVSQAKQFNESARLTGVVLTKLDGTAKGGIVIAISDLLKIPIKFIGVGEGVDDLLPFESKSFIEALLS